MKKKKRIIKTFEMFGNDIEGKVDSPYLKTYEGLFGNEWTKIVKKFMSNIIDKVKNGEADNINLVMDENKPRHLYFKIDGKRYDFWIGERNEMYHLSLYGDVPSLNSNALEEGSIQLNNPIIFWKVKKLFFNLLKDEKNNQIKESSLNNIDSSYVFNYLGNLESDNKLKIYDEDFKQYQGISIQKFYEKNSPNSVKDITVGYNPSTGKKVALLGANNEDKDAYRWEDDEGHINVETLEDTKVYDLETFVDNLSEISEGELMSIYF